MAQRFSLTEYGGVSPVFNHKFQWPQHSFTPLTPGLQLLPVTPSPVPFFLPPGIPQPDHEQLFCPEGEHEPLPEAQLPDGSHGVGMAHNEPHLCLCFAGTARGLLGHEE